MDLSWTTVGEDVIGLTLDDDSTITREAILAAIDGLEWVDFAGSFPASPGLAIKGCITELRIPKVSRVAISHDLAPFGLYGIEGHYTNGTAHVFVVDLGSNLLPVASVLLATAEPESED